MVASVFRLSASLYLDRFLEYELYGFPPFLTQAHLCAIIFCGMGHDLLKYMDKTSKNSAWLKHMSKT